MIKLKFYILFLLIFFLLSCSELEFVYNELESPKNPIYEKTSFRISGKDVPEMYNNTLKVLGESDNPSYALEIFINETKTKRSVQTNQAVSKLDYELKFNYSLFNIKKNCNVFDMDVFSRFSYAPKSSGYNFGSDQSLDKMYSVSGKEGLNEFLNSIYNRNLNSCNNEN